jgi:hypothetical protein
MPIAYKPDRLAAALDFQKFPEKTALIGNLVSEN